MSPKLLSVHEKISRPKEGGIGLRKAMGLGQDKARYKSVTTVLRELIDQHLDTNLTVSNQDKRQWQKYLEEVPKAVPLLENYVDCWPAAAYARIHISETRRCRWRYPKTGRGNEASQEEGDNNDDLSDTTSRGSPGPLRRKAARLCPPKAHHEESSTRSYSVPNLPGTSSSASTRSVSPVGRVESSPVPQVVDFRTCLQELDPILGQYHANLAAGGIKSADDLVDLIRLPRGERDALLKDPEGCNIDSPLRFRMVRVALEGLRMRYLDHMSRGTVFALTESQS